MNFDVAETLLLLYMNRCKLKHALAFFQFRKLLPEAPLHELKDIFNDRTKDLMKILVKAKV